MNSFCFTEEITKIMVFLHKKLKAGGLLSLQWGFKYWSCAIAVSVCARLLAGTHQNTFTMHSHGNDERECNVKVFQCIPQFYFSQKDWHLCYTKPFFGFLIHLVLLMILNQFVMMTGITLK
jgi:hypothetical protein